jgi:putative membrane protein
MNINQDYDIELSREKTLWAAERTFSAWLRTVIAAMAGGLAILRLVSFHSELHRIIAQVIGQMLIFWGFMLVILSSINYQKARKQFMSTQAYEGSRTRFLIIVIPLLISAALLIWITLP